MVAVNNKSINSKSWPFQEANRVLERCRGRVPKKGFVLFETGFGPSGLPHIGTFGEVMRTSMVKHAFEQISDIPTKLICFSDAKIDQTLDRFWGAPGCELLNSGGRGVAPTGTLPPVSTIDFEEIVHFILKD